MKSGTETSLLPVRFRFSQKSLQDFVDCPRRFQLMYIEHRDWPAVVAEPALEHERRNQMGKDFHRLVQQHQVGIDAGRLSQMTFVPDGSPEMVELNQWWNHYLACLPGDLPGQRYVEYPLIATVAGFRLYAQYDLLVTGYSGANGEKALNQATILDWKTSRERPRRAKLAASLQTRVYRYILALAGTQFNGGKLILPEQIQMRYWFANEPDQPEVFPYDTVQFQDDDRVLRSLISDIARRGKDDFPLTVKENRCKYCVYRSLCERGICAGGLDEEDEDNQAPESLELDLETVEEIAY